LVKKLTKSDQSEDLGVDGKIISELTLGSGSSWKR